MTIDIKFMAIENNMLPVPLKYTYPVVMELKLTEKRKDIYYYVPEISEWISYYSLTKTLRNINIDRFLWELRWVYKIDSRILADNNMLSDEIIRIFYKDKFDKSKEYIKIRLLSDITYKCDFFCLRSDIIDLFFKRELNSVYMSWYDFSLVPEFIRTRGTKFEIIVKERDFISGKLINNWITDYDHIISEGYDSPRVGKHKMLINTLIEQKNSFLSKSKEKFGNTVNYSEVEYKGYRSPVKLTCNICGNIYYQAPEDHLNSSINTHGCSNCNEVYLKRLYSIKFSEFLIKARKIHGNNYTYFENEFVDYNTPMKIFDNIRDEFFYQAPKYHLKGHGNNECQNSIGEYLIKAWLISNNIKYKPRVSIIGLIYGRNIDRVEIDFIIEVDGVIIWIEYNGKQHYEETPFFYKNNKTTFQKQLQRDSNVREYCKNNNIKLLEIPYTYKDHNSINNLLDRVILGGEDINAIIDYQSLYK